MRRKRQESASLMKENKKGMSNRHGSRKIEETKKSRRRWPTSVRPTGIRHFGGRRLPEDCYGGLTLVLRIHPSPPFPTGKRVRRIRFRKLLAHERSEFMQFSPLTASRAVVAAYESRFDPSSAAIDLRKTNALKD
jgi:hypothetical protein